MKLRSKEDWETRVRDCKRRATVVYPCLVIARKAFERYSRIWTYWENRAWDAQRMAMQATIVPSNQTAKSIERQKDRIAKSFQILSKDDKKRLLEELKEGV